MKRLMTWVLGCLILVSCQSNNPEVMNDTESAIIIFEEADQEFETDEVVEVSDVVSKEIIEILTINDFKLGEIYVLDGKKYYVRGLYASPSVAFCEVGNAKQELVIGQNGSLLQDMARLIPNDTSDAPNTEKKHTCHCCGRKLNDLQRLICNICKSNNPELNQYERRNNI